MGAAFLVETLPGDKTRAEVRAAFDRLRENARDEYGSRGYTGSWKEVDHVSFEDGRGLSLDALEDKYGDELGKGSAVAVLTFDDRVPHSETPVEVTKAREAVEAARRAVATHVDEVLARLRDAKSATKGCKCGSSIAVAHLRRTGHGEGATLACPVCHAEDFALSQGDRDRKARLGERLGAARAALDAAEAKARAKRRTPVWALLGSASC